VNPQDPLAALQPLRQGELIGWWPPAPGWWMLLALTLLILATLIYLIRGWFRRNAYRRAALQRLQSLYTQYDADHNAGDYIVQLNALLKSVALRAYPRERVAAAHGMQWRTFLNQDLPPALQLQHDFDEAAYQESCPDLDIAQVQMAAQHWIRKHRSIR